MFRWIKRLFRRKRFVEVDIKKVRSIQELSRGPAVQPLTSAQVRAMFPDRTKPQVPTSTTSLRPARTGGYADASRSYYNPNTSTLSRSDDSGSVVSVALEVAALEALSSPSSVSDDYSSSGSDSSNTDSFVGSGGDFGGGGSSGDY